MEGRTIRYVLKSLAFVLERDKDVIRGVKRIEAKEFVEEEELAEVMGWQSIGNLFPSV